MPVKYFILITAILLAPFAGVSAYDNEEEVIFYTNSNIVLTPHPEPETFTVSECGEIFGLTVSGISFYQRNISNDITRLQRFRIQEAWWYISDRGIIGFGDGLSDIQALSIYLTLPELTV